MHLALLLACSTTSTEPTPPGADGPGVVPTDPASVDDTDEVADDPCDLIDHEAERVPALERPADAPWRNVLLVTWDTTRRDHIGRLSDADGASLTPNLDALIDRGLTLTNHYSCSNWTLPSMTCMLTGRDANNSGYLPTDTSPVPERLETLAELLSANGYATGLFTANELVGPNTGLDAGYGTKRVFGKTTYASVVAAAGVDWLGAQGGAPFLLHLHFMDAHQPYAPPDAYLTELAGLEPIPYDLDTIDGGNEIQDAWPSMSPEEQALVLQHIEVRYSGGVRHMDDQLGWVLGQLEALGRADDTVVVVASDHGEQLLERGVLGHARSLHPEEAATFAVIAAPGAAPVLWPHPTSHPDLLPTVLALVGVDAPKGVSGRVVGTAPPLRAVHAEFAGNGRPTIQAAKSQYARVIYTWDGALELYDYRADPHERAPITDMGRCEVQTLWFGTLQPRSERLAAILGQSPVPPDVE